MKKIVGVMLVVVLMMSVFVLSASADISRSDGHYYWLTDSNSRQYIGNIIIMAGSTKGDTISDLTTKLGTLGSSYAYLDQDLNENAGGDYIYMGWTYTDDSTKAIKGLQVKIDSTDTEPAVWYEDSKGIQWFLVNTGHNYLVPSPTTYGDYLDLNDGKGEYKVYLYVTNDVEFGPPLSSIGSTSQDPATVELGREEFVYTEDGEYADLNYGVGSTRIYLKAKTNFQAVEIKELEDLYNKVHAFWQIDGFQSKYKITDMLLSAHQNAAEILSAWKTNALNGDTHFSVGTDLAPSFILTATANLREEFPTIKAFTYFNATTNEGVGNWKHEHDLGDEPTPSQVMVNFGTYTPTKQGYTFLGWNKDQNAHEGKTSGTEMHDAGTTFYAIFEQNKHMVTVTNGAGGGSYKSGDTVTITANAASSEQRFKEWKVISGNAVLADAASATTTFTMPAGDVTVEAVYIDAPYTVTYDAKGGTGSVPTDSNAYAPGDYVTVKFDPAPTYTDYSFVGWSADKWATSATYTANGTTSFAINADTTLYAIYQANEHTVSATDGDRIFYNEKHPTGDEVTLTAPKKEGYHFVKWMSGGTITLTNPAAATITFTVPGNSVVLQANYDKHDFSSGDCSCGEPRPAFFTVTFDTQGHGTAPVAQTISAGGMATDPGVLNADGYAFGGWYKEAACTTPWDFANDTVTQDTTIYAKWTAKSSDAGVTAVSVGGVAGKIDAAYNTIISVVLSAGSMIPTDSSAVSITPAAGASVSNLQTGNGGATWTFTVTAEDGTTQKNYTINVTVAATEPTITTTTLANGTVGTAYSQTLTATGDTPITWSIKAGTTLPDGLTLDSATGTISGTPAAAGTATFTVVATNAGGSDEQELSIIVNSAPPTYYNITVQNDGHGTASASPTTAAQGDTVTLTASPDTGYHFKEWQVVSGNVSITNNQFTMPASDVTINAIFEQDAQIRTYSVSVSKDGGGTITGEGSYVPGEQVTITATPDAANGYCAAGWGLAAVGGGVISPVDLKTSHTFTMPEKNVAIAITFVQHSYISHTNNGNGTHDVHCLYCGDVQTASEACVDAHGGGGNATPDGWCDKCDAAMIYTITVQADSNGTASASLATAVAGTQITLTAAPNTGYHFKEWQVVSGNVSIVNNAFTMPAENVTVKAVFEQDAPATYTVTWVNADGTVLETDTNVAYGTNPSYDGATPTKAADAQYTYTFAGWSPQITAVTGNVTYTAAYSTTVNKYTVIWVNEDGTELEKDENVPYGTTPSYDGATPAKPGDSQYTYVFVGWQPEVAPVTGNATYTARFADSANTYTVTWLNADGTVLEKDESVPYGTMPSYNSASPTKPSDGQYTYAFAGWTPELTAVIGDAVYTATFAIDTTLLTIVTQPLDQYVVEGQTATFTIEARGDGLTYQWYINRNKGAGWRLIDGATNPIHTTKTTDLDCDGFKYGCIVTDMHGNQVKSDVAILHVSAVPVLPETGDNSHPMLYLTLLLTSLAGMIVLKKKRVKV